MATYGIEPFDLVVSNLYPFAQDPGIETIDVGGPAMVRAAAKNHAFVTVVTDASQYAPLLEEMDANDNTVGDDTRRAFAVAAFASTAAFDAADRRRGSQRGRRTARRQYLDLALERTGEALRYGENPHQHGGPLPHRRHASWWDRRRAARRPRAQLPQPLRRRRRVAHRARPRRSGPAVRDHQARQPVRRRARRRPRRPRTSARSSATSAPRSAASSRSTTRSTPPPPSAWSPGRRPT